MTGPRARQLRTRRSGSRATPFARSGNGTHTAAILAIDVWIASFYVLLQRRGAVPRAVTTFGLSATGLHFVGIPLRSVLGYGPLATLGMPMALGHLALGTWLIVRGVPQEP